MEENETIESITRAYEEKIANREKEILIEKEELKNKYEKEKEDALNNLKAEHNKDIADIILGRKSVEEIQNKDNKKNDEKSFFDRAVEDTKKKINL